MGPISGRSDLPSTRQHTNSHHSSPLFSIIDRQLDRGRSDTRYCGTEQRQREVASFVSGYRPGVRQPDTEAGLRVLSSRAGLRLPLGNKAGSSTDGERLFDRRAGLPRREFRIGLF